MKIITLPSGHEVYLDDEDYGRIVGRSWHIHQRTDGTLIAVKRLYLPDGSRPQLYLQRVITTPPDGMDVDFRSKDGLDCRKGNLYFRPKEEMKARPDQYRTWSPVPAKQYNETRNNTPLKGAHEPLAESLELLPWEPVESLHQKFQENCKDSETDWFAPCVVCGGVRDYALNCVLQDRCYECAHKEERTAPAGSRPTRGMYEPADDYIKRLFKWKEDIR